MAPIPDDLAGLADAIEIVLRQALAPIVARLKAVEATLAEVEALRARLAALTRTPHLAQQFDDHLAQFMADVAADRAAPEP